MQIPVGVNHLNFLIAAKKKGVKISSKFVGVVLGKYSNGGPAWIAQYQENGKKPFMRRFLFTEQGEIQARRAYEDYLRSHNKIERRKTKILYKPR